VDSIKRLIDEGVDIKFTDVNFAVARNNVSLTKQLITLAEEQRRKIKLVERPSKFQRREVRFCLEELAKRSEVLKAQLIGDLADR
jgi:hypothetical protein